MTEIFNLPDMDDLLDQLEESIESSGTPKCSDNFLQNSPMNNGPIIDGRVADAPPCKKVEQKTPVFLKV
jgi:hypothetical protein